MNNTGDKDSAITEVAGERARTVIPAVIAAVQAHLPSGHAGQDIAS